MQYEFDNHCSFFLSFFLIVVTVVTVETMLLAAVRITVTIVSIVTDFECHQPFVSCLLVPVIDAFIQKQTEAVLIYILGEYIWSELRLSQLCEHLCCGPFPLALFFQKVNQLKKNLRCVFSSKLLLGLSFDQLPPEISEPDAHLGIDQITASGVESCLVAVITLFREDIRCICCTYRRRV